MEEAARRFARRVLLLHLLFLAVVVGIVFFAAREIYYNARRDAATTAGNRQTLLASQTARGVENYYQSIVDTLDLLQRSDPGSASPRLRTADGAVPLGSIFWWQLRDRASCLFSVQPKELRNSRVLGANSPDFPVNDILAQSGDWLQTVARPAISRFYRTPGGIANLVAVPVGKTDQLLVAVVPIRLIESRFLHDVNRQQKMDATLLDEKCIAMSTSDPSLVGINLMQLKNARIQSLVADYIEKGKPISMILSSPISLGNKTLQPRLITYEPVYVSGATWSLLLSSHLDDVYNVTDRIRGTVVWAILVIVIMLAILVSTSIQLIRGRMRMERMQHQILTREIDQARQIQLAWLPDERHPSNRVDITAVNHPASHISGDFYDWFDLPDGRMVVTIGDVTGHGMAAAFLMATTQLLVRIIMQRTADPGRCLAEVNRQLCAQVFSGQFVTMAAMIVDVERNEIRAAVAGHYPPLIGDGQAFESLKMNPQLVLGIEPDLSYPTERFDLPADASILLYTDGVLDVQSPDGDRFEIEHLRQSLHGRYGRSTDIIDDVIDAITAFRGGRDIPDDLTLVALQLQPASTIATGAKTTMAAANAPAG